MTDYTLQSFIDLYLHAAGKSQTPLIYHYWCAVSTIAACVADRVWVEKFKGERLTPNLYLMLLGPSGNGKGKAINFMHRLIHDLPHMNIWNGMITAPRLIDKLGKAGSVAKIPGGNKKMITNGKIILLTPEMAVSVGEGVMASMFVKLMTALYEGHADWDTGTRTRGDVEIKDCNINWIAGTTQQWMIECLPKSSIESGFLARSIVAESDYVDERIPIPVPPVDFEEVWEHLQYRCFEYCCAQGEFEISDDAYEAQKRWYMTRPEPDERALKAAWHRDDDLCWKLSMIYSLADSINLVIEAKHVIAAQKRVKEIHHMLPELVTVASLTPETEVVEMMKTEIKKASRITHRSLMQKLGARGKKAKDIHDAARTLAERGDVEFEKGPRGGLIYAWK